jgi:TonB-dependent starch-binding outer membrane protein SusC
MKNNHQPHHLAAGKMLVAKCVLMMTILFVPFGQFVSAARNANNTNVMQDKVKVSGIVLDNTGEPVVGAIIMEIGTSNATGTDLDGRFSLSVAGPSSVLRISFVGYQTIEQPVGSIRDFRITLKEDQQLLDEIVVIGYGTQRKADVTSSISSVKKDEFLTGNIRDAGELIKGKVAGLTITKGSGDPNAKSTIRLRGITSLSLDLTPLVLIDGIEGSLSMVAPENIVSMDVLKDASAAAIYGTRGANGVIIVTTNSGKRNEATSVNYSVYATLSDFYKKADFMTPHDVRFGLTTFKDEGWDTDWLAMVSQKGFTQNHNLSITGGTEKTSYSANVSYRNEDGTIKKSNNEELKMQFDLSHWMLNDKLKLNFNMVKRIHKNSATDASNGGPENIYRQAVIRNPTEPIYVDGDPSKGYFENFDLLQYYNPVAMINELLGNIRTEWTRMTGNITLEPIKGWQTNLMLSTNRSNGGTETYTTRYYYTRQTANYKGYAYKGDSYSESNQLELTSRYDKVFNGDHRFSGLLGYSYKYDMYDSFSASNYTFPTDAYLYNNIGAGWALKNNKAGMGSYMSDSKLIGFFGRISYGYKDKYNVLMSMRYEGSSKFGPNYQWGTFPAVSVGWTISKEDFMSSLGWITNLKLRTGYGVTGVAPGSSYQSITRFNYNSTSWGYYLNSSGVWAQSLEAISNPNPDLKWEKSAEFNVGLDFSFLNDKIGGSIDYYNKLTSDLLWEYKVPSPPNLFTTTLANVGKLRNAGIEVMIKATPVKNADFQYTTTVTLSHNSNRLVSLSNDLYQTENHMNNAYAGDPVSTPTQRIEVGSSFGKYWSIKTKGLSENGKWMIQNPESGLYEEYAPSMNTGDDYRQWMGNAIPKIYMGWDNSFTYKNFDLDIQTSGQFGFKIVNEQRVFYENNSISYNRLKSAADPIPIVDENGKATGESRLLSTSQEQIIVSWYYENGSFFKIDHVTLGYNVKTSNMRNINNFRVYLSGENLLCITKYKGMDPELTNDDIWNNLGLDGRDKYPTIRSLTLGVSINFK